MDKSKLLRQVASKLKDLQKQWGYERKEMAAYFGISRAGYGKNEKGQSFPGIKTLFRLSEDHDISIDWFMFDKGPMYFKEKEKMKALETKAAELEDKVRELELEKANLEQKSKEQEKDLAEKTAVLEISPEMKDLVEHMNKIPLLYHEVLAAFQKFKWDNKEMVETSMDQG
jgi:transcriptional regulator with XRE-family HTH domain